ncbi:MAG: S8 family serine peptidase, partial [Promethearchaeota archaeon]
GTYNISLEIMDFMNFTKENSTQLTVLQDIDSDNDQLFDHQEISYYLTNPNLNDTDADLLTDVEEILRYFTDPLQNDTDEDLLYDGAEILTFHTDPLQNDTDQDGFLDGEEIFTYSTNPAANDTDSDGCDDFSEVKFFATDPTILDCSPPYWDGGLVDIQANFRPGEPKFIPFSEKPKSSENMYSIPRLLYLYLCERIRNDRANTSINGSKSNFFYISALQRVSPVQILVIDAFNSTELEERVHGNTCVNILEETLESIFGSNSLSRNFSIIKYSVAENNRSWATAFEYAIAKGVDVISLSQVSSYGSIPFFDEISLCVNKYQIIFVSGTGNDNRGDPVINATNNLRYPATHPNTLVVGGVILNSQVTPSRWERWNEGIGAAGSNWGRAKIVYNNTEYFSAVELVADCHSRIAFSDYYGVSWAIPQVAAMAASILFQNLLLKPDDVRELLITSAIQITPSLYTYAEAPFNFEGWFEGWNPEVGYGMPNIEMALQLAATTYSP